MTPPRTTYQNICQLANSGGNEQLRVKSASTSQLERTLNRGLFGIWTLPSSIVANGDTRVGRNLVLLVNVPSWTVQCG